MAKQNRKTRQANNPRQTPKPAQAVKIEHSEKYWFGNIHIHGVGVVNGKARLDHIEKFKAQHLRMMKNSGLHIDEQPPLNEAYWLRDVDELELKKQRDRKPKPEH